MTKESSTFVAGTKRQRLLSSQHEKDLKDLATSVHVEGQPAQSTKPTGNVTDSSKVIAAVSTNNPERVQQQHQQTSSLSKTGTKRVLV